MNIFVIAGEPSGDKLSADIMRIMPLVKWSGIGGPLMKGAGLENSFFDYRELSLMGIAEIIPHIPNMVRRINETVRVIEELQPDIVLSVDCPEFSLRVQKKIKQRKVYQGQSIHYVAPSVWAWRPDRARKIARFLDGIICLFPCEPEYFIPHGLKAVFIGHPISQEVAFQGNVQPQKGTVGLFFGSRESEIKRMGPEIARAARIIAQHNADTCFIVPSFSEFKGKIEALLSGLRFEFIFGFQQKYNAMATLERAIITSGTVGLELAVAKVPHVMCYKMSPLTYFVGKLLVDTRFAHLGNILLKREVIPECIQDQCSGEIIAKKFFELSDDKEEFQRIRKLIGCDDPYPPAKKAADFISSLFSSPPRKV